MAKFYSPADNKLQYDVAPNVDLVLVTSIMNVLDCTKRSYDAAQSSSNSNDSNSNNYTTSYD